MDKKRLSLWVEQGEKFNDIVFAMLLFLLLFTVFLFVSNVNQPYDAAVTIPSADKSLSNGPILAKAGDGIYELEGCDSFAGLFKLKDWSLCVAPPPAKIQATLHFSEQYELYLYDQNKAALFNGYARDQYKSTAYYDIPPEVSQNVLGYIKTHGVQKKTRDGVNSRTFLQ